MRSARLPGLAGIALTIGLVGCSGPTQVPASQPRYVVGAPYQMGSVWSYPREDFALRESGLAAVVTDPKAGRRTVNGEVYDPSLLTAAHRTLQLPAVLRVTNLENGLELSVRVNDRGPARPGRLIELSRRAAELLKVAPGGGTQVAIAIDGEASRALAAALPQDPSTVLKVATAPREALQAEALPALAGTRPAVRVRQAPGSGARFMDMPAATGSVPLELPAVVTQSGPRPGRLMIQASTFTSRVDAQRQAAKVGGRVESWGPGRRPEYRVRVGPFTTVQQADSALETILRSGVSDARIIID